MGEIIGVHIAVLAIADDAASADLTSVNIVADKATAAGHRIVARATVKDAVAAVRQQLETWIARPDIDVVIATGGIETAAASAALKPLMTLALPGFSDLFRFASKSVGAGALSSAEAAQCGRALVFMLPSAVAAVDTAMAKLLLPQLDQRTKPKNLIMLIPRLRQAAGAVVPSLPRAPKLPPLSAPAPAPVVPAVPEPIVAEKTATGVGLSNKLPAPPPARAKPTTANVIPRKDPAVADPPTRPIQLASLERQIALSTQPSANDTPTKRIDLAGLLPKLPPGAEEFIDPDEEPEVLLPLKPPPATSTVARAVVPRSGPPSPPPARAAPTAARPAEVPAPTQAKPAPTPVRPADAPRPVRVQTEPMAPTASAVPAQAEPKPVPVRTAPLPSIRAPAEVPAIRAAEPPPPAADVQPRTPLRAQTEPMPMPTPPRARPPVKTPVSGRPIVDGPVPGFDLPVPRASDAEIVTTEFARSDVTTESAVTATDVIAAPAVAPTRPTPPPVRVAAPTPPPPPARPVAAVAPAAVEVARPAPSPVAEVAQPFPVVVAEVVARPAPIPAAAPPRPLSQTLTVAPLGLDDPAAWTPEPTLKRSRMFLLIVIALGIGVIAGAVIVFLQLGDGTPAPKVASVKPVDAAVDAPPPEVAVDAPDPPAIDLEEPVKPVKPGPGVKVARPGPPAPDHPVVKPVAPRDAGAVTTPDAPVVVPTQTPPTPEAVASDCGEVFCVMEHYAHDCCEHFRPKNTTGFKPANAIPDDLDRTMAKAGVEKVKPRVIACGEKSSVKGTVKLSISVGGDGSVQNVSVVETPDAALGECVAGAVRKTTFGKTVNGGTFTYPLVF